MSGDSKNSSKKIYVRTPLIQSNELSRLAGAPVYLKLENTQPSYSFKLRGVSNHIIKEKGRGCERIIAASGGNAGMAAAYAARKLGLPCTIYVPKSTPEFMRRRIEHEGAEVIVHGEVWDHANEEALKQAKEPHCSYIHPFDHPEIWEGHASMMTECREDLDPGVTPGLVILSVGGGGLMIGALQGMAAVGWKDVPLLAMETHGADCLNKAVQAGRRVSLPTISSMAKSLGALCVAEEAWRLYQERPILSEVISDKQCFDAMLKYADEHNTFVEPACGAALAAIYSGVVQRLQGEGRLPDPLPGPVIMVVCGGYMVNMKQIEDWRQQLEGQ